MRRFLSFIFALVVVLVAAGAELRQPVELPQVCACGCGAVIDPDAPSGCPCGMPQRSTQPCGGAASQGLQAPARPITTPAKRAEVSRAAEPSPLPARLARTPDTSARGQLLAAPTGADPPRSLDRQAQLSNFRI